MRSRYSAYARGDRDYLLDTWDPGTRPGELNLEPELQWRRLQIRGRHGGGGEDATGTVEFVAHYWDTRRREYGRLHEDSAFVRRAGRWLYVGPVEDAPGH